MKKLSWILSVVIMTTSLMSCNKYENGGTKRKAEERLTAHTWKLDVYLRNDNDETSQLLISNFEETFASDGTITRSYVDSNGDPFSEEGTWAFDNDKEQINLTGVGSIELTNETSTVSSSDYNILRLKKDELHYYYENGGDRHEFRFVPK